MILRILGDALDCPSTRSESEIRFESMCRKLRRTGFISAREMGLRIVLSIRVIITRLVSPKSFSAHRRYQVRAAMLSACIMRCSEILTCATWKDLVPLWLGRGCRLRHDRFMQETSVRISNWGSSHSISHASQTRYFYPIIHSAFLLLRHDEAHVPMQV